MKIGVMTGTGSEGGLDAMLSRVRDIESRGFASAWMANIFGFDAICTLALAGRETRRIELGTAVVPSYPRHPVAIAQQALTAGAACGGRFTLGIGLSHKVVIEDMLGLSYDKPAAHMREYISVLAPLLNGAPARFSGAQFRVEAQLQTKDAGQVPLLIAAMGERMLKLAGAHSAGTILWMTGPATIESHIAPRLHEAARQADRPAPRIVAGLPIALTDQPDAARDWVAKHMAMYGRLPSYRAMLDREGAAGPEDIAVVGGESALNSALARLRDAGVTDFNASIIPMDDAAEARTLEYLQSHL